MFLDSVFNKLNLKETHSRVYVKLLESGPLSVGNLYKHLGMPRSTLYGLLEDLNVCGLVTLSSKQDIKIWQAAPPEKVKEIMTEKVDSLTAAIEDFNTVLPTLKNNQRVDFVSPKFSYFEGSEGLKQLLKDPLMYRDIETEVFWPYKDMLENLGEKFLTENTIIKRIKRNIYARVIWPQQKAVDFKENPFAGSGPEFKREIRLAPQNVDSSMGYWAYANKVAFISSRKESFGFIVESNELRQLIKTQFETLWMISKQVTVVRKYYESFLSKL